MECKSEEVLRISVVEDAGTVLDFELGVFVVAFRSAIARLSGTVAAPELAAALLARPNRHANVAHLNVVVAIGGISGLESALVVAVHSEPVSLGLPVDVGIFKIIDDVLVFALTTRAAQPIALFAGVVPPVAVVPDGLAAVLVKTPTDTTSDPGDVGVSSAAGVVEVGLDPLVHHVGLSRQAAVSQHNYKGQ